MSGPTTDAQIYLLDDDEQHVVPGGPAVVGPDGTREEIPALVYEAVMHVVEAMKAGQGVKVSPLRPELPIDEAAAAIGMRSDDLRAYVAEGAVPFRSSEYVDWVRLADVLKWNNKRREDRRAGVREMLDERPWEDDAEQGESS